ncbi:hypothetical protein [Microbacterium sp. 3J1]|uniref:hypothetical protein n=1 Tax=Microbacterium sp. 3J1 TaxID=861269 RepID=UPI000AD21121|nr:hypothetical protein [Microbacterium sp. 3J1]
MTDPQLPPSGAVPSVPPAPQQPADAQPPSTPPAPAPPAYSPAPPAPPAFASPAPRFEAPTAHPAPSAQPQGYPGGAPAYPAQPFGGQPAAPTYQAAPPGAYQVPVGGYSAPAGTYQAPASDERRSSFLGILALVLAVVAAVVTPIVAGITGFEIGRRIPAGFDATSPDLLTVLSPARDQVLWAEISFWVGTLLGIAAIVLGIIAIRKKQGRGAGIAALVVAVLGPIVFWVVLFFAFSVGTAAGFLP